MEDPFGPATLSAFDPQLGLCLWDHDGGGTLSLVVGHAAALLEDLSPAVLARIPEAGVAGGAGDAGEDGVVHGRNPLQVIAAFGVGMKNTR